MKFARRMNNLFASEIRELLKLTENPEVISFAGGLPASELFPIKELQESSQRVFSKQGEKALQYSATEGITPLREWLADKESKKMKRPLTKENILITHGSQQALDLLGKLFIDEEDLILCESPTYLSAINVFRTFEGRLVEVPTDNEGMIPSDLERILSSEENIKLMYVIPTFQNPTGKTWSLERRSQVLQLAQSYEITIIEDNPYGELRYDGEEVQTIFSLNTDDEVILTGSFSKVLCPGYRLGWVVADQKIIEKLSLIKQSTDLQSNTIAQMEIYDYLTHNDIQAHINTITDVYKLRRNLAIQMIQKYFPADIHYIVPEGGLFLWLELSGFIDTGEFLKKSLKRNVAFVSGDSFYPNSQKKNTLRLNYSSMTEEKIGEGLKILGELLTEEYAKF